MSDSDLMSSNRFKYTEIWRDMIKLLHDQVSIKNRRHLLKSYTGVFTGANAVDVLVENIPHRQDLFATNTTREQVVRLCQRFLEGRVFFPARNDLTRCENVKFEDSGTSFYRLNTEYDYIGAPTRLPFGDVSNSGLGNSNKASSEPDLTRVDNQQQSPQTYSPNRHHGITKHFSFMRKQRFSKSSGFVESLNADDADDVFDIDQRIERECVRVRLLQLLDLPFVEGFVYSPSAGTAGLERRTCQPVQDLTDFHNHFQSSTDPYIKRAIDVLKHLPNGRAILTKIRGYSTNRRRVLLFEEISGYYNRIGTTLVSGQWDEVVQAIHNLMSNRKESNEALQLFLRLLDAQEREELQHLFAFLYIVSVSDNVPLSDRHSNVHLVQMKFAPIVFPCCSTFMLKFCLDRLDEAFTLPEAIRRQIDKKIQLIRAGEIDSPHAIPDALFARQVDPTEFQRQKSEGTNQEVLKLITSIRNDKGITPQRKHELISSLRSQHPNAGTSLV